LARALPDLPEREGGARGPAWFRQTEEGFVVDELPAYLPSGAGEHLYLHLEKRGISTPELVYRLQKTFGLHEVDIGYAGQKDAQGVTRQWVSVPARVVEPELARLEELGPVRLVEHGRHGNKLRLGHLRGNRFTIRLEGDVSAEELASRAAQLEAGIPNYFGAQRFGHDSQTLRDAERFVERRRPAKTRREKFWVSSIQSALFNAWLDARVVDGSWSVALLGDILLKAENGAPFTCVDPEVETPRVRSGETSPSGPLVGKRVRRAESEALTRESRAFEALGVDVEALFEHPAFSLGDRRPAILRPKDLTTRVVDDGVVTVSFTLPKGAYATVVLREWVGKNLRDEAFSDEGSSGHIHLAP
jgi:tRNA pseudouridine13 synthase